LTHLAVGASWLTDRGGDVVGARARSPCADDTRGARILEATGRAHDASKRQRRRAPATDVLRWLREPTGSAIDRMTSEIAVHRVCELSRSKPVGARRCGLSRSSCRGNVPASSFVCHAQRVRCS